MRRWSPSGSGATRLLPARPPNEAKELERRLRGELPAGWDADIPTFPSGKPVATRNASEKVINAIAPRLPELMGGAADLAPSTKTLMKQGGDFEADNYAGRNMHFGVREHGMGAVLNGMALHGGILPYGASFLIFSDYMRPPIRLAALMERQVIYVYTHDSIGLGEDGPPISRSRCWRPCAPSRISRCSARPTRTRLRRPGAWRSAIGRVRW